VSKKAGDIMDDLENPQAQIPTSRPTRFVESREARRERSLSGAKPGFPGRIAQFLRDVRAEMKRVSWPSARDVKNTTIITVIAVIFFAIYLFAVDQIWAFALTRLNQLLNWIVGA
jgi:preprotein translocase subunit SecE